MVRESSVPPYVQIANDLRQRIGSGALKPGQRVPSTRRLAATWKVALATASKALGLLVQEGVLRTEPRVGNVVTGTVKRDPVKEPRDGGITRAAIVRAGIAMADHGGLDALSMRGIAATMGLPVTSLYRHVARKEDLLAFMVEAIQLEESHPSALTDGWRARLEHGARMEWRMARKHPWVVRVLTLTRPIPSESSLAHAEWMLRALEDAGVDAETGMRMHVTIYGFVQGLATNLESEAQAQADTGLDEAGWMQRREPEFAKIAASNGFPSFARTMSALSSDFDLDLDGVFEFGLGLLLDGLASRVGAARGNGREASA